MVGKQYTVRGVPNHIDCVLRQRVRELSKSLNQVVLEALQENTGGMPREYDDLDFLFGSMKPAEAKRLEREIKTQRRVDPTLRK